MKNLKKSLFFGLAVLFCSGIALSCPQVGGYSAQRGFAVHNSCSYVSNNAVRLGLGNVKTVCPRFILTDPNYKFAGCQYNRNLNRCVCVVTRRR